MNENEISDPKKERRTDTVRTISRNLAKEISAKVQRKRIGGIEASINLRLLIAM